MTDEKKPVSWWRKHGAWMLGYAAGVIVVQVLAFMILGSERVSDSWIVAIMSIAIGIKAGRDVERWYLKKVTAAES